ncbi:AfsR/SARP family transcriptional regulator [Amycolatopsis sp.]|uniref:AfsR/SARP family transcriptional regulator n=1 Tax=Amycolatopsis sp. TaxID=37632 RepID=UPI002D7F3EDB|nr:BTAD domain-containing putative transcriptional regulator [Amycolatopsis sp.]HET6705771.1 BTAD domain-containing putative transcriptional regulator [Amycolatopsis sp.]
MEIRLLGPLEIRDNSGATTRITSARQRVIFAALAMQPGQVVSAESLVDCLWGDEPPVTARETVHSHVTRLRKNLSATARARIVTRTPGYSLDVAPHDVDVFRVRELHQAAAECGDPEKAVILLGEARTISRGDLLADVDSELLRQRYEPAWEEFRVRLAEAWIDAGTAVGNHAGLLGELRELVAARPLAEQFRGRLMLALQATGQTAEALREYQEARRALIDGLGVEPGRYLRSVQQQILTASGEAAAPAPARPTAPAELPHARRGFVGRVPELAELEAATAEAGLVVVHGMGGIGKTTTAVHWAHHARDRFPDGQLYLDLRGFDHTEAPMRPAEALPRLLHSLGVPPGSVPADVGEQAARLRSLLADRRTLVLLDNAADAEQVRPLLPGGRRCVVLVTSRTRLTGLIAREHAAAVRIGPFSPAESADLLAGYLGPARPADDIAALAAYCGHVPLALGIVAARALEEPAVSPAELTARLRAGQRLDAFDLPGENLRTVFSWSYRALSPAAARLFRLLAVHPGQTVSAAGVAALAGAESGEALSELTRANLLDRSAPGRYRCHDLLRDYAAELAGEDPEAQVARHRVLDWYLHTTAAAERRLRPHRPPFELVTPIAAVTPVAFPDHRSAMRWCDAEQANLVAAIDSAAAGGLHEHAWQLALAVSSYCYAGKRRRDWLETSEAGLRAARQLGDPKAEGALLASLGSAHAVNGQYDEAIAYFRQALDLHRATGDDDRAPVTLNSLAVAYAETRRFEPALAAFTQAMQLHRDRGNTLGEALALMNIALANSSLGRLAQATTRNREALAVFRRRGDRYHTAICLANLAETYALREDHRRAVGRYRQAIAQHLLAGNDYGRARTLMNLGRSLSRLDEPDQARDCWRRARDVFEALGDPQAEEASALIG